MRTPIGLWSLALLLGAPAGAWAQRSKELGVPWWIYVGTFAGPDSKGIQLFQMKTSENPDIPEFVTMSALGPVAETSNVTSIEVDPKRPALFAVSEVDRFEGKPAGPVSAFALDARTGKLTPLNRRASGGPRPCHLALDRDRRHLLVANCGSGSVAVLPVGADGKLGEPTDVRPPEGKTARAGQSQAQGVAFSPDNQFAFVCDQAGDRIVGHRFDTRAGKLAPRGPAAKLKPGAGPRRMLFRPDGKLAYVLNELDSTVAAFGYDAQSGTLKELGTWSTLPGHYDGPNRATEIGLHPSGKYLLVSNSGHNSVVLFDIEAAGTLRYVEDQSTYGTKPVHFGMDSVGKHFAVANRESGSLLILRAPESGRVKPGGNVVKVAAPACAVFMPAAAN